MSDIDPSVTQAVITQIELWAEERNRVTYTKGVLYDKFKDKNEFELVGQYAKDLGESSINVN